jgi:hypothetical protein
VRREKKTLTGGPETKKNLAIDRDIHAHNNYYYRSTPMHVSVVPNILLLILNLERFQENTGRLI